MSSCRKKLKSVNLNTWYIQDLEAGVFYGCENMSQLSLQAGVNIQHIGDYAFYNCRLLNDVSFSDVQTIGEYSFYGCEQLQGEIQFDVN